MKVAIHKIKPLGHGFELIHVGDQTLVKSVPQELDMDKTRILEIAQRKEYVSKLELVNELKWTEDRVQKTLQVSNLNEKQYKSHFFRNCLRMDCL